MLARLTCIHLSLSLVTQQHYKELNFYPFRWELGVQRDHFTSTVKFGPLVAEWSHKPRRS